MYTLKYIELKNKLNIVIINVKIKNDLHIINTVMTAEEHRCRQ